MKNLILCYYKKIPINAVKKYFQKRAITFSYSMKAKLWCNTVQIKQPTKTTFTLAVMLN